MSVNRDNNFIWTFPLIRIQSFYGGVVVKKRPLSLSIVLVL